jgi:kinesin family protein 6/9
VDIHHKSNFDAVSNKNETWSFKYHNVLHNATQDAVYDDLVRDVVTDACNGVTGCVMSYGQTGSGKTFTMIGDPNSYRNRGIVPRVVAQVFSHIASKPEMEYSVSLSYMELYGEKIRDLLVVSNATQGVPAGTATALGITVNKSGVVGGAGTILAPGEFNIVEDPVHGTVVRGLTLVPAVAEEDVLNTLFKAELGRTTADHYLNKNSNRSHCIFTIYIQQRSRLGAGKERIISSKIHLVDLAGSERIKKTMGTGPTESSAEAELARESMAINKSLTYLQQCVVALTTRGRSHVPYKNSRLTNVLKDALGGNCNTIMIACIWGEARHLEETISTLKFAQRMMSVQNEITEAAFIDTDAMLKKLTREVAQLKQELQMHGGSLVEGGGECGTRGHNLRALFSFPGPYSHTALSYHPPPPPRSMQTPSRTVPASSTASTPLSSRRPLRVASAHSSSRRPRRRRTRPCQSSRSSRCARSCGR